MQRISRWTIFALAVGLVLALNAGTVHGFGGPDPEGVYLNCPDCNARPGPSYSTIWWVSPYTSHKITCNAYHYGAAEANTPVAFSLAQASQGSNLGAPQSLVTDSTGLAYTTIHVGPLSNTPNAIQVTVLDSAGNTTPHRYAPQYFLVNVEDHSPPTKTPTALPAGITSDSTVFPNPFNPKLGESAHIYYKLATDAPVKISIYTLKGNLVYERSYNLLDGSGSKQGIDVVEWNGRNDQDVFAANGVYVVVIRANDQEVHRLKVGLYKGQ